MKLIELTAAIKHKSGKIFSGHRHAYAYERAREENYFDRENFVEGFIDSKMNFYTRQEAGKLIFGFECYLFSEDLEYLKGRAPVVQR